MELQRPASMSGPLSPAYSGQVPYNYNQLEGRFKQLQGEPALGDIWWSLGKAPRLPLAHPHWLASWLA